MDALSSTLAVLVVSSEGISCPAAVPFMQKAVRYQPKRAHQQQHTTGTPQVYLSRWLPHCLTALLHLQTFLVTFNPMLIRQFAGRLLRSSSPTPPPSALLRTSTLTYHRLVVSFQRAMSTTASSPLSVDSRIPLSSGHSIPLIGLGTWRSPPGQVQAAVKAALLAGYRHIDGAWTYGNEAEVGEGIRQAIDASNGKLSRSDLFITSKVWNNQLLPADLIACCRDSLSKLNTDYIDLYLIHWPIAFKRMDPTNPQTNKFAENDKHTDRYYEWVDLQDTWTAMESLVKMGLVRSIGVSNHNQRQIDRILSYCTIPPATNQVECHPYLNQRSLYDYLKQHNITLTAYSPLGNVARDPAESAKSPLNDKQLETIASKHSRTVAQVILRWHVQRGTIPVPKSVTESRIVENLNVFDSFVLDDSDMSIIDSLGEGEKRHRFINPPFLPRMQKVFDAVDEQEKQEKLAKSKNGKL